MAELPGGGSVVLRFDEWVGRHYLLHGSSFDPAELGFMRTALEPGTTAIDVGANVGVYTITAALRVGSTGRVIAIEADEEIVAASATGSRTPSSSPRPPATRTVRLS